MIKAFIEGFLLAFRRRVWVIERLYSEGADNSGWDALGSIVGEKDADSAVSAARSNWSDEMDSGTQLRAVPWAAASAEQREVASYEDDLRAREAGIREHARNIASLNRQVP